MAAFFKKQNYLSPKYIFILGVLVFIALAVAILAYNIFISSAAYQATGRVYPNADFNPPGDFNGCVGAGCANGHWDVLNEVSYDFSDYIFDDNGGDGEVEEFRMTEAAGPFKTVGEVEVNFRAYAPGGCNGNCDVIEVNIFIDGAYRGSQFETLTGTDTLHTLVWSGSYSGDDDLRVQLTRRRQNAADNVRITRVFADIEYTQPNDAPTVDSVTVTPPPGPGDVISVTQGDTITFDINWSDNEGDSARAIVCKTRSVVGGSNPGCPGDAWVGPSPLDSSGTITLNYTTNSNDALNPLNEYYIYVCDSPGGECSANPPLLPSLGDNSSGYFAVQRITAELYDWAWSENIGWISFNHTDCDTDDPPDGDTNDPPCDGVQPITDYSVTLDTATGYLSGNAWSSNIGWVSFKRSDTGTPPAAPFNGVETFTARLEGSTLRGWARALAPCETPPADGAPCDASDDGSASGWDGWIRMDEDTSGGAPSYPAVTFNGNTEEFEGWAWGDEIVGWISFNSSSDSSTWPYSVKSEPFNAGPAVTSSSVSFSASSGPTCTSQMRFMWDFNDPEDGDTCDEPNSLCGYRLQVSNSSISWLQDDLQFDSGVVRSGASERFVTIADPATNEFDDSVADGDGTLAFNSTYYWRVQVYDSDGEPSEWYEYQDNTLLPEPFDTSLHAYPSPDFDWSCTDTNDEENDCSVTTRIQFNDLSTFNSGDRSWQWTFPDEFACIAPDPTCEDDQNPRIEVSDAGDYSVTLTAIDGDLAGDPNSGDGECSITRLVTGQFPLPDEFIEVTPVSFFDKIKAFFSRIFSWEFELAQFAKNLIAIK